MSGYQNYTRVSTQTQVNKVGVCKGSQWAVFISTVVHVYVHKGSPCVQIDSSAHGVKPHKSKGVSEFSFTQFPCPILNLDPNHFC